MKTSLTVLLGAAACAMVVVAAAAAAAGESSAFIAVGDWGGIASGSKFHAATQRAVAVAMAKEAETLKPEFVVGTGDNFYYYGVTDTEDPKWEEDWEGVYNSSSLADLTWIQALGNHDYGLEPEAQVEYAATHPRWVMPARYYQHRVCIAAGGCADDVSDDGQHATFIVLDTNPCVSAYRSNNSAGWDPKPGQPNTPAGYAFHKNVVAQNCSVQRDWLQKALATVPSQDWLIGMGHHRADEIDVEDLMGDLIAAGMDVWMNGHHHHLGYYHLDGAGHYITTGAGCFPHLPAGNVAPHMHLQLATNGRTFNSVYEKHVAGFSTHTFSADLMSMTTRLLEFNGTNLYDVTVQKNSKF